MCKVIVVIVNNDSYYLHKQNLMILQLTVLILYLKLLQNETGIQLKTYGLH